MQNINFKNLGKAILIIILYLVIIPTLVSLIISPFMTLNDTNIVIINLILYLIDLMIVLFIYRKDLKKEWQKFCNNFKSYAKIAFKNWLIAFAFMVVLNAIVILLLGKMATNESENRELLTKLPILSTIMMVFMGPIMEEFAFRKGFKNALKNKQLFLIVTSLLFGAVHVISNIDYTSLTAFLASSKELLFILPYFAMGYFFGKAYYETDCIFTSILAHMFHNGFSVIIILLGMFIK